VNVKSIGSSKVIDFGTDRMRACNFLLVRHSNLGPVLHRFGDIAGFLLLTQPLFHSIFEVFPFYQIAHIQVQPERKLIVAAVKLFSKYSNLCDHNPPTL